MCSTYHSRSTCDWREAQLNAAAAAAVAIQCFSIRSMNIFRFWSFTPTENIYTIIANNSCSAIGIDRFV